MSNFIREKYIRPYAGQYIFCPGCGDGIVLQAFARVIEKMGNREEVGLVSGIGCSSYIPVYLDFDAIHSLHGRAITVAEGLKLAQPDKKVVVFTGDGDSSGIGGNHLIHAARRNIDLTVIMLNNNIYGMTGGQVAPTTPTDSKTKTTPYGNIETPFDVCSLVIAAGATKVSRWTVAHANQIERSIEQAINHKGFSFVEIYSQCPVQAGRNIMNEDEPWAIMQAYKNQGKIVRSFEDYLALKDKIGYGDFYHVTDKPEFIENLQKVNGDK